MKFELVDDLHKWYKMGSIWFFALLALAPQIYDLATQYHLVSGGDLPGFFVHAVNIVGFVGAITRLIKQKSLEIARQQGAQKKLAKAAAKAGTPSA